MYQVMPSLSTEEYAELKTSIAENGVMVSVEYDEDDNILDGHHRVQACKELGITDWPKVVRSGLTEPQKLAHARYLNLARRHLNQSQRRQLVRDQIKETPNMSDRKIGRNLDVSHATVRKQRNALQESGQIDHPPVVTNAKKRNAAKSVLLANPNAVNEDLAKAAGCSEDIIKEVRKILMQSGAIPQSDRYSRDKARQADRLEIIRGLAQDGLRSGQIAMEVGLSPDRLRKIAKDAGIALVDGQIGSHRIDPNRVVEETVTTLAGCSLGLQNITENPNLDSSQINGWITSLEDSFVSLRRLLKMLKERRNGE